MEPRPFVSAEIVCVDTWLGSLEMWLEPDKRALLSPYGGMPNIWPIFRNNVLAKGFDLIITPFPATSRCAARFFAAKGVRFDLVYIDASHEYADVVEDIRSYLPLAPVIFGDDFDWPNVASAVNDMANLERQTSCYIVRPWLARGS